MFTKEEKLFVILSITFSVLHAMGYIWLGYKEGYTLCIIAMVILDLIYIPVTLIKSIKLFPAYLILFSMALVFITAFTTSELYNNYSALLCLFVAILIFPKYKNTCIGLYLLVSAVAFCIAGDPVYYLVIHTSRALWIFIIYDFIIEIKYNRKPVILFDEEKEILEQLTNNLLQKEIELKGFSERTIRRRLEAAKKRNGLNSTEELKELYLSTYKK